MINYNNEKSLEMEEKEQQIEILENKKKSDDNVKYSNLVMNEFQHNKISNIEIDTNFDKQEKKLKIKKFLSKFLLHLTPTIIATFIYLISLIGCYESFFVCLKKYPPQAMFYGFLAISSAGLFYVIQLYLFFFKKVNYICILFELSLIFFLCFIYDTGTDLIHHGGYNRIILIFSISFWLIFLFFSLIIYKLFKKLPIVGVLLVIIVITLSYWHFNKIFTNSCRDWMKGFKGTHIINSDSGCIINSPKVCYYRMLDGYFDLSKIFNANCGIDENNRYDSIKELIKDQHAKIIGFPLTNAFDVRTNKFSTVQNNVLSGVVNMEDPALADIRDKIEVSVNYYKAPPEVNVNIKKNENLVAERRSIVDNLKNQVMAKNVLYLFIDSLSRANFSRKLPKFWKWIEEKYNKDFNSRDAQLEHESFQFFKFHGVGRYTRINMVPVLFGIYNNNKEPQSDYFIKYFKDNGFITGSTLELCSKEVFEIEEQEMKNINWEPYDHEFFSLFCDPNFTPYNNPFSMMRGPNSIKEKCLYNKNAIQHELKYLNKFWEVYKEERKFFRMSIIDAHEGTYEAIKYDDDILYNFFRNFEKEGKLKDTIIIIQTDHGNGQPGPFSLLNLDDFYQELSLPSLFMVLPTDIKNYSEIRRNLKINEQSFITPFTLHNSFLAILNDKDIPFSIHDKYSVFSNEIPNDRNCKNFIVENSLCRCDIK